MRTKERLTVEPDQTIKAAAWGYTSLAGALLGTAKGRIVAMTERGIYIFQSSYWRPGRPRHLAARYPVGSLPVHLNGWTLEVDGKRIVVHLHHRNRARGPVTLVTAGTGADR